MPGFSEMQFGNVSELPMAYWTTRQDRLLCDLYPEAPKAQILAMLPHTWDAIRSRACLKGISRRAKRYVHVHSIVEKLTAKRLADGISQDEMAKRVGVARETISRFENGRIPPRLESLERWCAALDMRLVVAEASREAA
jgi:DNA-binding XRE family transcriptional regulator